MAFEFNGPQHYGPIERFPDVDRLRAHDDIKIQRCLENDMSLIIVTKDDPSIDGMAEKIGNLLPVRHIPHDHPVRVMLEREIGQYLRAASRRSFSS